MVDNNKFLQKAQKRESDSKKQDFEHKVLENYFSKENLNNYNDSNLNLNEEDLLKKMKTLPQNHTMFVYEPETIEEKNRNIETEKPLTSWQRLKNQILKIKKIFQAPVTGRIISIISAFLGFALTGFLSGGIIPLVGIIVTIAAVSHGIYHDTREEIKHLELAKEKTYVDDYIRANNEASKILERSPNLAKFIQKDNLINKNKKYPDLGRTEPYFTNSVSKAAWNGFLEIVGPIAIALFKPIPSLILACVSGIFNFAFASKDRYEQDVAKYSLKKTLIYFRTKVPVYESIGELSKHSMQETAKTIALSRLELEENPSKELFDKFYNQAIRKILSHPEYAANKITKLDSTLTFSDKIRALKKVMSFEYKRNDPKQFNEIKYKDIGTNLIQTTINDVQKAPHPSTYKSLLPPPTPNLNKSEKSRGA